MSSSKTLVSKEQLIAFERRVADAFEAGLIRAPVHLSGGNEDALIEIFQQVRPQDWVFSTWRSHYHALLKGIPEEWLWGEILAGRSMYIESREHKFLSSSIVGGVLPIALGVALGARRAGLDEQVWVFVGDMTWRTGIADEVRRYARNFELPLRLVLEDNGLSTNTPTREVWGENFRRQAGGKVTPFNPWTIIYSYQRQWPHVGVGKWVTFG